MMDFNTYKDMMNGGSNVFMWLMYILMTTVLVLGIAALLKYINKK